MPIGTALAYGMDGMWFKQEETDFKKKFDNLMYVQAAMTGVAWLLLNLVITEKPEVPPSEVATVPYERLDFK